MNTVSKNTNKYSYKILKSFKSSICCFIPLQYRVIEGKIHFITVSNNLLFLDFGFKNEVELFTNELKLRIQNLVSLKNRCNLIKLASLLQFKILVLDTFFFNKILIKKIRKPVDLKLFYDLLSLQQKKRKKKYYIKGRFLNIVKGGFCIGISGYVAFLPLSHAFSKKFGRVTFFYLLSIDLEKKSFVVSQARIQSVLWRRLKRLRSRLIIIKKISKKKIKGRRPLVNITQSG